MSLTLAGLDIRVLSGPVSLYYLTPLVNGLPCLLLLGDYHFSLANMARQCDEEEGCYTIYSDSFLLALDKLAETYPIDFFIEFSESHPSPQRENVMEGWLKHKVYWCSQTEQRTRAEYEHMCPTRNIRFHRADVRFMKKYLEYEITLLYLDYVYNIPSVGYLLKRQSSRDDIAGLFRMILDLIPLTDDVELLNQHIQNILILVAEDETSGCGKQIRKVRYEIDWKRIFGFNAEQLLNYKKVYRQSPGVVEEVLDAMFGEKVLVVAAEHQHVIREVAVVMLFIQAWFFDLYTVARMLKTPKDNTTAYLSIGMFGDTHTENIVRFLKEQVYTSVYEQSKQLVQLVGRVQDRYSRQIVFYQPVDIDSHLQQLAYFREDSLVPYFTRLGYERSARAAERESTQQFPSDDREAIRLYRLSQLSKLYRYNQTIRGNVEDILVRGGVAAEFDMDEKEIEYVVRCGQQLLDFMVLEVGKGYFHVEVINVLLYAVVIASLKSLYDLSTKEIYEKVRKTEPKLDRVQFTLTDIVTDIEVRTGFQLCAGVIQSYAD